MFDKNDLEKSINLAFKQVEKEFDSLHDGRVKVSLFDSIKIDIYGANMPLNQVSVINVIDNFTVTIKPFDKNNLKNIYQGIQDSGLKLTAVIEGDIVRVVLPKMTEERRKDMVKILNKYNEDGKIRIRQIRQDFNNKVKKMTISEDQKARFEKEIQKIIDDSIKKIDTLAKAKEALIMKC